MLSAMRGLREKYGGTYPLQSASPAGRILPEVEPENQIHKSRAQEVDVAGNVHHVHVRGKHSHRRAVMLHELTGNQECHHAKQTNNEVNAAHESPVASWRRILAQGSGPLLTPRIGQIHASSCGS